MLQRVVALPAGQDVILTTIDFNIRYVGILNIGTGRATLAFDVAAVSGQGYPLMPAAAAGDAGGGFEFDRTQFPRFGGAIHAISTAGTSILVMSE